MLYRGAYEDGPEIWVARPLFFYFVARPIFPQKSVARPLLQKIDFWPVLISAPVFTLTTKMALPGVKIKFLFHTNNAKFLLYHMQRNILHILGDVRYRTPTWCKNTFWVSITRLFVVPKGPEIKFQLFLKISIENFATFRNSNWKFWLIYTLFNYGNRLFYGNNTWNRLFGPFYPRYELLVH